ncbi:MAG: glycosyltransferase family 39 protein [Candidatus Omnitrophica bacterium]|nr:glycosyltransferase family 39 protein [Candidatus Omnitrophota bacterium]
MKQTVLNQTILNWTAKFAKYILILVGILYVVKYLYIVFSRINYPFELEWMEGGILTEITRIRSGQKLYVSPSLEYVPLLYAPLYFYISAAASTIIGLTFTAQRLVSFISSLGCFYVIFLIVYKETRSKYAGILASCLFAASYPLTGGWFDMGRVDVLFLLFLLLVVYLVKFASSSIMYILAGIVMVLAFLTKQSALLVSLPIMLYCLLWDLRRSIYFIGTTIIVGGSVLFLLNYIHDGWYNYFFFSMAKTPLMTSSFFKDQMFAHFWKKDILPTMPIALALSIFFILAQFFNANKKNFLFYSIVFIDMVGISCLSRVNPGGGQNSLLMVFASMAILFGMAFNMILESIHTVSERGQSLIKIFLCLICVMQFCLEPIRYNTALYIPNQRDLEAGKELVRKIKQIEGEVFIPDSGYLSIMAGKKSYAHGAAIRDILMWDEGKPKEGLLSEIENALQEKRFSAIVLSSNNGAEDRGPGLRYIKKYYIKQDTAFEDENVFWPVSGLAIRPEFIYVPRK